MKGERGKGQRADDGGQRTEGRVKAQRSKVKGEERRGTDDGGGSGE